MAKRFLIALKCNFDSNKLISLEVYTIFQKVLKNNFAAKCMSKDCQKKSGQLKPSGIKTYSRLLTKSDNLSDIFRIRFLSGT